MVMNPVGIVALRNIAFKKAEVGAGGRINPNDSVAYNAMPGAPTPGDFKLLTGRMDPRAVREMFEPTDEDWGNYGMFYDQVVTRSNAMLNFQSAGASYQDLAAILHGYTVIDKSSNAPVAAGDTDYTLVHRRAPANVEETTELFQLYDFLWNEGRNESWLLQNACLTDLNLSIPVSREVGIQANFMGQDKLRIEPTVNLSTVDRLNTGRVGRLTGNNCKVKIAPETDRGGTTVASEEVYRMDLALQTGLMPDWRLDGKRQFATVIRGRRAMSMNITWLRANRGIQEYLEFLREIRNPILIEVEFTAPAGGAGDPPIITFKGNMRMSQNAGGRGVGQNEAQVNTLQLSYNSTPEGLGVGDEEIEITIQNIRGDQFSV